MGMELMHNFDTERGVIAAILVNADIYQSVRDDLSRDLFTDANCIFAYDIIRELEQDGKLPDITEVGQALLTKGMNVTSILTEEPASYIMTMQRIELLKELATRRQIYNLCYRGMQSAGDPTESIDKLTEIFNEYGTLLTGAATSDTQSFSDVTKSLTNDISERIKGSKGVGMNTGLHLFDSHYGLHTGDLVIIAGSTSAGKSTLATTMARNMASEGVPIAYYSMEMTSKQLAARIIARDTLVPSSEALYGSMSDEQYSKYYDTATKMATLPIYFDERSKTSVQRISASVRKMVKRYGIKVVFVDYLQILANGGRLDSREQILGDMARDLKRLAVDTDTCVVALSQLSRSKDSREASLSRLRGSGQIEEASDMVILIDRKETKNPAEASTAKLTIAKGRNVGLGSENVKFCADLSYFADIEQGDPQAAYRDHDEEMPF